MSSSIPAGLVHEDRGQPADACAMVIFGAGGDPPEGGHAGIFGAGGGTGTGGPGEASAEAAASQQSGAA